MSRLPPMPPRGRFDPYRPPIVRRRRRRRPPRRRFNWAFVLVPAAILLVLWIISGVEPAGTWGDVMNFLDVKNRERYTMLGCLGLVVVAVVLAARILRGKGDEES